MYRSRADPAIWGNDSRGRKNIAATTKWPKDTSACRPPTEAPEANHEKARLRTRGLRSDLCAQQKFGTAHVGPNHYHRAADVRNFMYTESSVRKKALTMISPCCLNVEGVVAHHRDVITVRNLQAPVALGDTTSRHQLEVNTLRNPPNDQDHPQGTVNAVYQDSMALPLHSRFSGCLLPGNTTRRVRGDHTEHSGTRRRRGSAMLTPVLKNCYVARSWSYAPHSPGSGQIISQVPS